MLVSECVLPRVIALEMALMTKRGDTPFMPSSGTSACRRAASVSGTPSTASPAYRRSFLATSSPSRSGLARRVRIANTEARFSTCGSRCTLRKAGAPETSFW